MHISASARPGSKTAWNTDARIDDAGAIGERLHGHPKLGRARYAAIDQGQRSLVHAEVGHAWTSCLVVVLVPRFIS